MRLLFGEYAPDQPDHLAEGLSGVSNVLPAPGGYRPVGSFEALTSALAAQCKGAALFVSPSGNNLIIAGTETALYRQSALAWTQLQDGYNIQGDGRWRFAQFGGLAIATNGADPMVKIDLTSGTASELSGSPPKFKLLAVVQNFLVGGVMDGDTSTIGWCGENNAEYWTFGSNKSDYNIFPDGGEVTGLLSGEFGVVLLRNAVMRMTYVGGNVLFRFDKLASNIGCVTVHSVAQHGQMGFWYSDSGFMMWDGAQIVPIGNEKVDRTFADLYTVADWGSMSTAIDSRNKLVFWSLGSKIWAYNWSLGFWTILDISAEIIFGGVTKTLGVDEDDPDALGDDTDIDDPLLDSFDDPRFTGGDPRFYVFNTSHVMGTLTGDSLPATFQMRNAELVPGRDARVRSVTPLTDAVANITLTLGQRQRLGDAVTNATATSLTASGAMPIRARGRYLKPSLAIAAGASWTYAQGLDVKLAPGGMR